MDVFLKKVRKGGGSFSIQKITLQILLVSKRYILVVNFGINLQSGGRGNLRTFYVKMSRVAFTRFCHQIHQSARIGVRGGGFKASVPAFPP